MTTESIPKQNELTRALSSGLTININTGGTSIRDLPDNKSLNNADVAKYDTFLEGAIENTFVQIRALWQDQEQLQREQDALQREHKSLLSIFENLYKQQEMHVARELTLSGSNTEGIETEVIELFSTRNPKDAAAGFASGMKSFGKGLKYGAKTAYLLPLKGAREQGARGFAKGVAKGVSLGATIPLGGFATGIYQITRGLSNESMSKRQAKIGMKWDYLRREWFWPETSKRQESLLLQLESSLRKQDLKLVEQKYKIEAQKNTLKKIEGYLSQQEANIGKFTEFDKEKYKFLLNRLKEEEQENQRLKELANHMSLNKQVDRAKHTHQSVEKAGDKQCKNKSERLVNTKQLTKKEKIDLEQLKIKNTLGNAVETSGKFTSLYQDQFKKHEKHRHSIEENKVELENLKEKAKNQRLNHDKVLRAHSSSSRLIIKETQEGKAAKVVLSKAIPIPVTETASCFVAEEATCVSTNRKITNRNLPEKATISASTAA